MRLSSLLLLLTVPLLIACAPIQASPPSSAPTHRDAMTGGPSVEATAQPSEEEASEEASDTSTSVTPQAALERLFTGTLQADEWFDETFLSQVPPQQITELITQISGQLGAFVGVEGEANPYTLIFELGTLPAEVYLDENGRINGLWFGTATLNVANLDEAVALVEELPGATSVLVTKNGEEVAALNADIPMGVGSAFKLAVLAVLRDQIEVGEHAWDEVVPLAAEWKAPPSSLLKDWPDDSPVTLHTLATLMISISDNTAADALLHIVGREEIEAITPNSRPLLTVHELFKLKVLANAELLERYRNGDEAEKRQVLDELAGLPLPGVEALSPDPIVDVEWFFSASELCVLMAQVEDLELMSVAPGPAASQPQRWSHIAFKGGSELGVLNLTTWLETEAGDSYCVVLTQNNPDAPINEDEVVTVYQSLLSVLE